jgi:hypothetical protein
MQGSFDDTSATERQQVEIPRCDGALNNGTMRRSTFEIMSQGDVRPFRECCKAVIPAFVFGKLRKDTPLQSRTNR